MDEITQNIRAALISTKEACDIRKLRSDYRMIVGEDIPYRKFGFSTVEDLLKTIPSVRLSYLPNGEAIVSAVTTQDVAHIVNLVATQKNSKKRISYASSRVKSFHPKFGPSKGKPSYPEYRKPFPTSKKSYYVPPYRRHSEFSYTPPRVSKSSEPKRRSVFERIGPKNPTPEYDDEDEYYDEPYEEEEPPKTVKSKVFSVADRLKNVTRREVKMEKSNDTVKDLKIQVKIPAPEGKVSGLTNRFSDILNKVSEIKKIEESSPKMENISKGPTSRMSDIFQKMSEIKNNSQSNLKPETEEKKEQNGISENNEPNRMSVILQKMSELKIKETTFPIPEVDEQLKSKIQISSRVSEIKKNMFNNPPPGFSAPGIDRPRMRIHNSIPQSPNVVINVNSPFDFNQKSPLASPNQTPNIPRKISSPNVFAPQASPNQEPNIPRKISSPNLFAPIASPNQEPPRKITPPNMFAPIASPNQEPNIPRKISSPNLFAPLASPNQEPNIPRKISSPNLFAPLTISNQEPKIPRKISSSNLFTPLASPNQESNIPRKTSSPNLFAPLASPKQESNIPRKISSSNLFSPLASPNQESNIPRKTSSPNLFALQNSTRISNENIRESAGSPVARITKSISKTNLFYDSALKENVNPDLQKEPLEFVEYIAGNKDSSDLLFKGTMVEIVSVEESPIRLWFKIDEMTAMSNFQTFTKRIDAAYSPGFYPTDKVSEGKCYITQEKGEFHRVRVLKLLPEIEEVECLLVDYGITKVFKISVLRKLMKKFSFLPPQTISCFPIGLQDLDNFKTTFARLKNLRTYKFLAKIHCPHEYTVEFFEIDNETSRSVNRILFKQIVEDSNVSLNELRSTKGFITHIDKTGEIYVQLISEAQKNFYQFFHDPTKLADNVTTVKKPTEGVLYLLQNINSKLYERCRILEFSPNKDYAQIHFIDSGKVGIFTMANITLYETTQRFVNWFPGLAIRTKLDFEPWETPRELSRFVEQFSGEKNIFGIRIIRQEILEDTKIPICDFFLPTENEKGLVSLKKLVLQKIEQEESNIKIPNPVLPIAKSFFNVKILHVVSPYLFYAQAFDKAKEFQKLMKDLQYSYLTGSHLPKIVTPGFYYAFKHVDGIWYRVVVKKLVSAYKASIFFCDFGFQFEVDLTQLFTLKPEFYNVPCQAVKLKLTGVKPLYGVWTPHYCDIFAQMVESKNFVCYVIKTDEFDLSTVNMFDTTGDSDVNISSELIDKKIATYDD